MSTQVAAKAKASSQPTPSSAPVNANLLQRKCDCGGTPGPDGECAECREKRLQRRSTGQAEPSTVPPVVHDVLRSPGQPLEPDTRAFMEPRFGHDFDQVRVHTDARAAESARAVDALAYTVGRNVVFGAGRYAPGKSTGRKLLAHELSHVVQQGGAHGSQTGKIQLGSPDDAFERQAEENAITIDEPRQPNRITSLHQPVVQRDLARPPQGAPASVRQFTPEEIETAITFNQDRFRDPYSIRVVRDVLGLEPLPAIVDEEFVGAVAEWQAAQRMTQDGQIGHLTTRSLYLELVAEGQLRDAILLLMDSYSLPGDLRLNDVRVGTGANCCGPTGDADAVTFGGPHCPPVGGPITVCFCHPRVPRTTAEYDHFVRITGHELIHVPQCAVGTGNVDVDEFEAFFFEACGRGRAPQLSATDRVDHANIALSHFARIPAPLRTPARISMRDQLNNLIAAGGVGPCP